MYEFVYSSPAVLFKMQPYLETWIETPAGILREDVLQKTIAVVEALKRSFDNNFTKKTS